MTRYVLFGNKKCAICQVGEKLLKALGISFLYTDVATTNGLAAYQRHISDCNGDDNKLPGLLLCEVIDNKGNAELLKRLLQGDAVIDYLEVKRHLKEKKL